MGMRPGGKGDKSSAGKKWVMGPTPRPSKQISKNLLATRERMIHHACEMDDKELRTRFGIVVKARRKERGLSLTEMAARAGISVKTAGGYESGNNWPSLPVYFRLCGVLRCGKIPLNPTVEAQS